MAFSRARRASSWSEGSSSMMNPFFAVSNGIVEDLIARYSDLLVVIRTSSNRAKR